MPKAKVLLKHDLMLHTVKMLTTKYIDWAVYTHESKIKLLYRFYYLIIHNLMHALIKTYLTNT